MTNELPEHVRGAIPELADMDQWIEAAEDQLRTLSINRQAVIDQRAQSVAHLEVGHEYEDRNGRRFRVTKVKGDYYNDPKLTPEPIVWVRYRGVRLFKNGNEGREETLYPPTTHWPGEEQSHGR